MPNPIPVLEIDLTLPFPLLAFPIQNPPAKRTRHHRRIQEFRNLCLYIRHSDFPAFVILHLLVWHEPQGCH